MATLLDQKRLLGLEYFEPSEALRHDSRFQSAEEYITFLKKTDKDPEAYWAELARKLVWENQPTGLGDTGQWFPNGRLNLSASCLAKGMERVSEDSEVVIGWNGKERTGLTRDDLFSRVGVICQQLISWDLHPGARVLLALPCSLELLLSELACLHLGLACVPYDPTYKYGDPRRLYRRAHTAACQGVITESQMLAQKDTLTYLDDIELSHRLVLESGWEHDKAIPPSPVSVDPMQPAYILFNSAGRMFSVSTIGIAMNALSSYCYLLDGRGKGDLHWVQTMTHHATFASTFLGALFSGGGVVISRIQANYDAFFTGCHVCNPRVMVVHVRNLQSVVSNLKPGYAPRISGPQLLIIEGDLVVPSFYKFVRNELFDGNTHVVQVVARSETSGFLAGPYPAVIPVQAASAALPAPGMQWTVLDNNGKPCPTSYGGVVGFTHITPMLANELQILELPILLGLRIRVDKEGRLWTMGDVKLDQPIKQVSILELEAMIASLSGVKQVAVVRYNDVDGKLRTYAFVKVLDNAKIVDEIRIQVKERFGAHEVPEFIQLVQDLPYSKTGKLLRSVLRRIAAEDTDGLESIDAAIDPLLILQIIADSRKCKDSANSSLGKQISDV